MENKNIEIPAIALKGICKTYRTKTVETLALDDVNLDIAKGEFLSIMGPSGCGKSTMLNIMGLLDRPTKGTVLFDGEDMLRLNDRALARFRNETLGFVFQNFQLINTLDVFDNVMMPLTYRKGGGIDKKKAVREALERVGLGHRMHHNPTQLSGGQAQRVAIARAIACNPKIILADEPCGNLDSHMSAEIMDLLHRLNREDGRTVVMVTHNEEQAKETDRIVRFFDGKRVF